MEIVWILTGGVLAWFILRFVPDRIDYARRIADDNTIIMLRASVEDKIEKRKRLANYAHQLLLKNYTLQEQVKSYNSNLIGTHRLLAQTEELKDELLQENINLIDLLKQLEVKDDEINRACRQTIELRAAV